VRAFRNGVAEEERSRAWRRATYDGKGVALVSNALEPPPDEGMKKCAQKLAVVLAKRGSAVYSITPDASLAGRKLLLSRELLSELRARPLDAVVYLPTQSVTTASLARAALLRAILRARVIMVALQPRELRRMPSALTTRLGPDLILTPSPSLLHEAERSGFQASYLPLGADLDRFRPASATLRAQLRAKYGIPNGAQVVLHVGHARRIRGLEWLARLADRVTVLVVIGSSLGVERDVVDALTGAGVRVFQDYIPDMQEIYQLADVYAFPARNDRSAIAAPLSVLEAMACNLRVVATPFGALPRMFVEDAGFFFAADEDTFRARIFDALQMPAAAVQARRQALTYTWEASADAILAAATSLR
jgi:glycosyltransferase involved in cell wall biosynthesis